MMTPTTTSPAALVGPRVPDADRVLTPDALAFITMLQRAFGSRRRELLARRAARQRELDSGAVPTFLPDTTSVREGEWTVAPAPPDLDDRRVEITGPVERKMMVNALNSGAKVFMADFEDSLSPTWENVVAGQGNCIDAVRRTLRFDSPEGKAYRLGERLATLVIRPRGWHLDEKHVHVDGAAVSASLFDFGLFFFHNAAELRTRDTGPYFYLPKLQSHLEARLWNDVFVTAQQSLGIPRGTVRATVLVETIHAAFEMDEILFELREHAAGLNAGRWDYLFSMIKTFRERRDLVLPERGQLTMTVPFMRAYTELLVRTCHRRGAHAIGGMAAFIPSRRDANVNATALAKVGEDKRREAADGFDGSWVAHPDLVPPVLAVFNGVLGDSPHQKDRLRPEVKVSASQLIDTHIAGGTVTLGGVRTNINVAIQYIDGWLRGTGAVGINNLMEDAATAEISRAQLWQWIRHGVALAQSGTRVTAELYRELRASELEDLVAARGTEPSRLREAAELLDELVLGDHFEEFLTTPGYRRLT
ncbi:MAG: malate synthase A [Gemmatimonadaceae bacterium]